MGGRTPKIALRAFRFPDFLSWRTKLALSHIYIM